MSAGGSSATNYEDVDEKLLGRIESSLKTVRAWDDDPDLLKKCRDALPFFRDDNNEELLSEEDCSRYGGESNTLLFLKRLCVHFKSTMTWINNPTCRSCGSTETKNEGVRGPETDEEREGQASRVEVYSCAACNDTTTFPRYNSVAKLFETKSGRCGEYANLFGLVCRSVGFETRYVHDVTDHVWVECYIHDLDCWVMADGCEGVINEPGMYESGWGKELTGMVAVATDHVVDVTPKYTRKWNSAELQTRRREVWSSSEDRSQQIIETANGRLRTKLPKNRIEELKRREAIETQLMTRCRQSFQWEEQEQYGLGRISGSLQWKKSRSEAGKANNSNNNDDKNDNNHDDSSSTTAPTAFFVESFYCRNGLHDNDNNNKDNDNDNNKQQQRLSISVHSPISKRRRRRFDAIVVNDCPCAVETKTGGPRNNANRKQNNNIAVSVVVLDERCLGCVLQSRFFSSLVDLAEFVDRLPKHRVVALQGQLIQKEKEQENNEKDKPNDTATNEMMLGGNPTRTRKQLSRLGGLDIDSMIQEGNILYVGQVRCHPSWTICSNFRSRSSIIVQLEQNNNTTKHTEIVVAVDDQQKQDNDKESLSLKLRTEYDTKPSSVSGRLPESIMPLQTQLLAREEQKRDAFFSFIRKQEQEQQQHRYTGYTTKPGSPIFLLDTSAYPFKRVQNHEDSNDTTTSTDGGASWNTFHFLPAPLVAEDDVGIITKADDNDNSDAIRIPKVDIPLETTFFAQLLGNQLLKKDNSNNAQTTTTESALHNCRLVALYFSAHWCPPCKRFTPMLIEMYEHLKTEVCPTHGLEIVFVSSDRDPQSFSHYYGTMPWLAIPFDPMSPMTQIISQRYGVRGIPSLVVLDAMSGQIVASTSESRNQVTQACHGGEEQIEKLLKTWLEKIPQDSKDIVSMLEVSCIEDTLESCSKEQQGQDDEDRHARYANSYLFHNNKEEEEERKQENKNQQEDSKARFMKIWAELVEKDGMDKNQAAAKAIELVSKLEHEKKEMEKQSNEKEKEEDDELLVSSGSSHENDDDDDDDIATTTETIAKNVVRWNASSNSSGSGGEAVLSILNTACKYLFNAQREPWTSKFRVIKLSNKFADRGITRWEGGIPLLKSLGFEVYETSNQDFFASIPLYANLDEMQSNLLRVQEQYDTTTKTTTSIEKE